MTTTTLLGSIREHLDTFDLPEPWSVRVVSQPIPGRGDVSVQLAADALPSVASQLLAWVDTLTEVSSEVWRVYDGGSVHLGIRGRLADGTTVYVFDGVAYADQFGVEPGEHRVVSLACVREWASFDAEVAA
ncbi:hypothetical protein ACFQ1S_00385 [Kibdelosporangium lantanae]|uniref:Uncharacterized protein n=1 Tax=Kibdelosporangium lantanae TaxID=1497396 RepID=A0ABW3M1Z8_9PSEU